MKQGTPMKQTAHFHVHDGDGLLGHAADRKLVNRSTQAPPRPFFPYPATPPGTALGAVNSIRFRLAQAGDARPSLSLHAQWPGTGELSHCRFDQSESQALVKEAMKKDNDEVLAGKIGYSPRSSCKPAGVPGFMAMGGGSLFVLQSPKEVTLVFDGNLETRHILLNVPHSANPKPSWYGDSVGHYEGDTLVVDTIALNTKTFVDAYRTPHTDKLHVTERWRLLENGNTLEVLISVDDPDTFDQPWQAVKRYTRQKKLLVENSCAENNDILFDYGTPKAEKPIFDEVRSKTRGGQI
jgi:hypothetical protein